MQELSENAGSTVRCSKMLVNDCFKAIFDHKSLFEIKLSFKKCEDPNKYEYKQTCHLIRFEKLGRNSLNSIKTRDVVFFRFGQLYFHLVSSFRLHLTALIDS